MDQSNEDTNARLYALNLAAGLANGPNGWPDDHLKYARRVYTFLLGNDPIVDRNIPKEQESSYSTLEEIMEAVEREHPSELSNVIYLEDYRREEEDEDDLDDEV